MNVLIAPDKFKGSISAPEITRIFAEELSQIPSLGVVQCPLADGGDGTAEILTQVNKGEMHEVEVLDPLFRPVLASFGYDRSTSTAYIEMAAASGVALLNADESDPMQTSTYGTGQLLHSAIKMGATNVILGVGGSATNDGGIGAAAALGYTFLDRNGVELSPIGSSMMHIAQIIKPRIHIPHIEVAVDVTNPFCGPAGAAYTYGPQKGASDTEVEILDQGMHRLAEIIIKDLGVSIDRLEGAGAAGGLAGGMVAFANATLKSGISIVMDQVDFDAKLRDTDLVITGEGKFDETSLKGKVVGEVIARCNHMEKQCIIVCGQYTIEQTLPVFSLIESSGSIDEAMQHPDTVLKDLIRTNILPILQRKTI